MFLHVCTLKISAHHLSKLTTVNAAFLLSQSDVTRASLFHFTPGEVLFKCYYLDYAHLYFKVNLTNKCLGHILPKNNFCLLTIWGKSSNLLPRNLKKIGTTCLWDSSVLPSICSQAISKIVAQYILQIKIKT